MPSLDCLLKLRPFIPWVCTSLALGYAAYIHWRLHKVQALANKLRMNKDKKLNSRDEVNIDSVDRNLKVEDDKEPNGKCSDIADDVDVTCCQSGGEASSIRQLPQCRRSAFAFFVDYCTRDQAFKSNMISSVDFSKRCAAKWKQLSHQEKEFYRGLSRKDKKRYERERNEYRSRRPSGVSFNEVIEEHSNISDLSDCYIEDHCDSIEEMAMVDKSDPISETHQPIMKRFSMAGDLEDLAFDIFCADEMPKLRLVFAPLQRRMSGEEMLDELERRWDTLPVQLRDVYLSKANVEVTKQIV